MHSEKAPRFGTSNLDGGLRYRVERTSLRAGVAPVIFGRQLAEEINQFFAEDE